MLDNCEVDTAPVNDTLWAIAWCTTANWQVGDLEELRVQFRVGKTDELPGAEHDGQSANVVEMPLDDKDIDEWLLAE